MMSLKLLLPLLALFPFSNAAPASQNQELNVSPQNRLLQYVMPNVPPHDLLLSRRFKLAVDVPTTCDSQERRKICQEQFARDLGQTTDIFTDPEKFYDLVGSYYRLQPNRGILNLCSAQVKFRNCLNMFYKPCTDAFNIFRDELKDDINQAFRLADVYDDIEFDCGGGLTQGLARWNCIVRVNNNDNYNSTTDACYTAYNQKIKDDPTYQNYCPASDELSLCLAKAYATLETCAANNKEIQWWACERTSRHARFEGFCTDNPCAELFPRPTTPPTTAPSSDSNDDFMDFVNAGGLFSPAKHRFYELAGMSREHKTAFLAEERRMKGQ